ncbi:forkhead box protein L3 isoform X2 [Lutzomyia longipalpis]|uniref:Putative meiosis-specific transcription factor mei4 pieris rapae n=1 Tax=Lutzomyia longipalpis TaxID=7200 RepID=A0A1B0CRB5_LUTLO|nr:forkhead box protein L3 isoform X2 [Lutzomyia longipalpis]
MCSHEQTNSPEGSQSAPSDSEPPSPLSTVLGLLPLDPYRLQLYNYAMAERLRCAYPPPAVYPHPYSPPRLALSLLHSRVFPPEEPKPQHSYIGLIAMAILSSPESKLVLSDIYQHILDHYPYFRSRGPGWRNSIRHNLSLNDCFVKAGRSANGKGHYWAIHPANVDDFRKGDFRRRKAQRKVRKHMGLAVDDDGTDSPSPPPDAPLLPWQAALRPPPPFTPLGRPRKRQFDVASLLAPDEPTRPDDDEIDVVAEDEPGPPWHGLLHHWPRLTGLNCPQQRPSTPPTPPSTAPA